MIRKICILFFVNIFILSNAILYSDELFSLDSLLKEAIQNNPEILAAKKRWEASLARVPQAKSLDKPTVGFSFMKIPKGTLKLNKTMPDDRMLSVSQMFPLFGKLSLKGKIAFIESQMLASDYKDKELEVINKVKNAYYDLFMKYKEIELNEASLAYLENIAKVAEAKYTVGEIPQEDVLKIYSEIAKLNINIANLRQGLLAKNTRLNSLLDRKPEDPAGIPTIEEDTSFNQDIETLYRFTLENQPELIMFAYAIEKNKYAKSLAKRSFFPDVMAEIGLRRFTAGGIGPWDIMLAFTMPFWFWTKQRYEVKEAIANLDEAKAAYEAMKNKALAETKELYSMIEISKNKAHLYKTNLIPILESSIESSLAEFRSAESDALMLLDSIRMLIETKMSYYKALVEYKMNLSDLERAVGKELREVTK